MQHRIDTLEAQLATLTQGNGGGGGGGLSNNGDFNIDLTAPPSQGSSSSLGLTVIDGTGGSSTSNGAAGGGGGTKQSTTSTINYLDKTAPQVSPTARLDTFTGGLALNAHGQLRFYGPTSSYRAVLADSASILNTPTTVHAIRAFSLTRAPIPTAEPCDPTLPRRPPELSADLKAKILSLAFEYCFSHYNIVPESEFYHDFQLHPFERTQNYSPFLLNTVLAVGCRYLDPDKDEFPPEICGLIGDKDTRGDIFITWARHSLDQVSQNSEKRLICAEETALNRQTLFRNGIIQQNRRFEDCWF